METCFDILQHKFDQKLTNRCIGLMRIFMRCQSGCRLDLLHRRETKPTHTVPIDIKDQKVT